MSDNYVTVRVHVDVKSRIRQFADKLGMSEGDVVELAIRLMELILKGIPLNNLKIYVDPSLLRWLYQNSLEFRNTMKHICEELVMSSNITRLELSRKFDELRARLHSKQSQDSYAELRQVLDEFEQVHSSNPGTAHQALQTLLDLYLRDELPSDLLGTIHVLTHEPSFTELDNACRQGKWIVVCILDKV